MCEILSVSKSGYYKYLKDPEKKCFLRNKELTKKIISSHELSHCIYGSPRITVDLRKEGYILSESTVARIMNKNKIYSKIRKKFKPITTVRDPKAIASANLLEQNFKIERYNLHTNKKRLVIFGSSNRFML